MLYKVTPLFLDYFGINSTEELPKLKDVIAPEGENTIGEVADVISDVATPSAETEEAPEQE